MKFRTNASLIIFIMPAGFKNEVMSPRTSFEAALKAVTKRCYVREKKPRLWVRVTEDRATGYSESKNILRNKYANKK